MTILTLYYDPLPLRRRHNPINLRRPSKLSGFGEIKALLLHRRTLAEVLHVKAQPELTS